MDKTEYKILVINTGSTSTKLALFENENEIFKREISYPVDRLVKFKNIIDQFSMRKNDLEKCLKQAGIDKKELSLVVARGGILPPIKSGAYLINKAMVEELCKRSVIEHASNLAALMAYEITLRTGISSYIYDSIAVDEMGDLARISGIPELPRYSNAHTLNSRAMAIKTAKKLGGSYDRMNFIVAHLGGGVSVSAHQKGLMVDLLPDDEGPLSPERAGRIPAKKLVGLCFSGKYEQGEILKFWRGQGGLSAYFGTNDLRKIQEKFEKGEQKAGLILEAMAYQVAKGIGELATVLKGDVDRIIITGGIAHSALFTGWIKERVEFIAPVEIMPGENEMEALALGVLRVMRGEEKAREYTG